MDIKGQISPSSQGNDYIFVILDAFSHFVVITLLLKFPLNMLFEHYSIIGILNLAHRNISSPIEVLKIKTKKWLMFVPSLWLIILHDLHTRLVQLA